jgi:carboxypeptidase C (cathepsin A)
MNFKNKLDRKKRLNFVKFEEKYNIIKSIKNGEKLKTGLKWIFTSKFNKKMCCTHTNLISAEKIRRKNCVMYY